MVDANTPEGWRDQCDVEIARLASLGETFTAEDVRKVVGDPPNHPNAMGARFLKAVRANLIARIGHKNGTRRAAHARLIGCYRGITV